MARVHLLTVHPESDPRPRGAYLSLLEDAALDRHKIHQLVDDPNDADIILFAEIDTGRLCEYVRRHPFIKKYRNKCFMFSTDWRVIPFIPGIYTSLEKSWYLPQRSRSGFYLSCLLNPLVKFEPDTDCDLLFSFMGDIKTRLVRRVLAKLRHPRSAFVDTASQSQAVMWRGTVSQKTEFWQRYVDIAKRSKFILCPRGLAPSSIRLFETMCMGRVPVVLSDEWVRPPGPLWDAFILQVPEKDAHMVPDIIEERERDAHQMGLTARKEWEKYYAPEIVFHRVVELCLDIRKKRRFSEPLDRFSIIPQLLRPRNFREYLRQWKRRLNE